MARREGMWLGDWHAPADGTTIASRQLISSDSKPQIHRGVLVMENFADRRLVSMDWNETVMRFYEPEHLVERRRARGFVDVVATNGLTDEHPHASPRAISIGTQRPT